MAVEHNVTPTGVDAGTFPPVIFQSLDLLGVVVQSDTVSLTEWAVDSIANLGTTACDGPFQLGVLANPEDSTIIRGDDLASYGVSKAHDFFWPTSERWQTRDWFELLGWFLSFWRLAIRGFCPLIWTDLDFGSK